MQASVWRVKKVSAPGLVTSLPCHDYCCLLWQLTRKTDEIRYPPRLDIHTGPEFIQETDNLLLCNTFTCTSHTTSSNSLFLPYNRTLHPGMPAVTAIAANNAAVVMVDDRFNNVRAEACFAHPCASGVQKVVRGRMPWNRNTFWCHPHDDSCRYAIRVFRIFPEIHSARVYPWTSAKFS